MAAPACTAPTLELLTLGTPIMSEPQVNYHGRAKFIAGYMFLASMMRAYGCFFKLRLFFGGRPSNKSPTIWGLDWSPRSVGNAHKAESCSLSFPSACRRKHGGSWHCSLVMTTWQMLRSSTPQQHQILHVRREQRVRSRVLTAT